MMDGSGVMVSCNAPGYSTSLRCCGIRLGRDWVLTTGNLLANIMQTINKKNDKESWKSLLDTTYEGHLVHVQERPLKELQVFFTVILPYVSKDSHRTDSTTTHSGTLIPHNKEPQILSPEHRILKGKNKLGNSTVSSQKLPSLDTFVKVAEFKSVLKYIWRSPQISEAVDTILSSWALGSTSCDEEDNSKDQDSDTAKHLLPLFLILKLQTANGNNSGEDDYNEFLEILHSLYDPEEESVRRGQNIFLESTPFGNFYFYNSISEGIISNVVGPGGCLLLTDATSAIGSEGGPIFVTVRRGRATKRHLLGMVVCSVSWWHGEWVGFTLGVALQSVFQRLLMIDAPLTSNLSLLPPRNSSDELAGVDDCVVLVRCGVSWGSGVAIDSRDGIILTCSHVVRNARNDNVEVYWENRKFTASILFRSRDGVAYDVAVLRVKPGLQFHSVTLSRTPAVPGEPVVAAGFPLFSEEDNVRPTVARGVIAHVSNPVAVLQSTCCVQSGASGGALFRYNGDLVGLIACNTVDTNSGALFPRINMAVPASVLAEPLDSFLRTGDIEVLSDMESKDPVVQQLWKLQTKISKL